MQSGNMFFFWLDLLSCLLLFVIICGIIAKGRPLPYRTKSILNISGMSNGAISKPAVIALSAKAWVEHYNRSIHYGVGLVAHACGVNEPGQLRREHVSIVTENSLSIIWDKGWPLDDQQRPSAPALVLIPPY